MREDVLKCILFHYINDKRPGSVWIIVLSIKDFFCIGNPAESPSGMLRPSTPEGYRELRDFKLDLENSDSDGEDVLAALTLFTESDMSVVITLNTVIMVPCNDINVMVFIYIDLSRCFVGWSGPNVLFKNFNYIVVCCNLLTFIIYS